MHMPMRMLNICTPMLTHCIVLRCVSLLLILLGSPPQLRDDTMLDCKKRRLPNDFPHGLPKVRPPASSTGLTLDRQVDRFPQFEVCHNCHTKDSTAMSCRIDDHTLMKLCKTCANMVSTVHGYMDVIRRRLAQMVLQCPQQDRPSGNTRRWKNPHRPHRV